MLSKETKPVVPFELLFWLLLTPTLSLLCGISILGFTSIFFLGLSSIVLGQYIISWLGLFENSIKLVYWGTSFFVGLLASSISYLIFKSSIWPLMAIGTFLFIIDFRKKYNFHTLNKTTYLLVFVLILASFPFLVKSELFFHIFRHLPEIPDIETFIWPDPYFQTNIVESLTSHGLGSASFEAGTKLKYHFLGYAPASVISYVSGLNSYQSLHSIWIPLCFLFVTNSIMLIANTFDKANKPINYILSIGLFMALVPINHNDLIFNLPNDGTGYLIPCLNSGTNVGLIVSILAFASLHQLNASKKNIAAAALFSCLLIVIKVTLFFAFGLYLICFLLLKYYFSKEKIYLLLVFIFILVSAILYKGFISDPTGLRKMVFEPLYLIRYVQTFAKTHNNGLAILIYFVLLLLWGNYRWISLLQSNNKAQNLIPLLMTGIAVMIFVNTFEIKGSVPDINLNYNGSFDLIQFIKAFFFLLSLISINTIGKCSVEYGYFFKNKLINYSFLVFSALVIVGWALPMYRNLRYKTHENPWLNEINKDLSHISQKDYILAIYPQNKAIYSGHAISSDLGDFWVSIYAKNGGYNFSSDNIHRWKLYDDLMTDTNTVTLQKIKQDSKKIIFISTPDDHYQYNTLSSTHNQLIKVPDTKWLYQIQQ